MDAMGSLDYGNLSPDEAGRVASAIARGENFYGYIPSGAFDFIKRNCVELRRLGVLEDAWLSAYIFKSHFADYSLEASRRSSMLATELSFARCSQLMIRSTLRRTADLACSGGVRDRSTEWVCPGPHRSIRLFGTPRTKLRTTTCPISQFMRRLSRAMKFTAALIGMRRSSLFSRRGGGGSTFRSMNFVWTGNAEE